MTDAVAPKWVNEAVQGVDVPGELHDFAAAITKRRPSALRMRREADSAELPLPVQPIDWYRLGFQPLQPEPRPSRWWGFFTGDFYLQDAGSMLALAVASADTNRWSQSLVCDLCASPGGKASALLEAMGESESGDRGGFVLANEVIRSRLGALQWNLARTGSDRYAVSNQDPERLAELLPGVFDLVLVDAPCSGQALVGRGKQRTSALSPKQIEHSAARQRRIVDAAITLLRPGGTLVYSTCTFSLAENESQIRRVVEHGSARPIDHEGLQPYYCEPGCYRLWPHRDNCAGSFAASLVCESEQRRLPRRTRRSKSDSNPPVDLSAIFDDEESTKRHQLDSAIVGWPHDVPDWVTSIAVAGPELAHRTGQTWKPSHAAALRRVARCRTDSVLEVGEREALAYLRGEPIQSPLVGWHVIRFRDRSLGWAKGNGRVAKNHLPAAGRFNGDQLW